VLISTFVALSMPFAVRHITLVHKLHTTATATVRVEDKAGVQPVGHRLSLRPQTDLQPTSNTQPWSAINGLHPNYPCNYMDYYSFTDPGGMEDTWPRWLTHRGRFTHRVITCKP